MKKKTKKKKIGELQPPFCITVTGTNFDDIEKKVEELKEHLEVLKHLPDPKNVFKLPDSDIPDEDLFKYLRLDPTYIAFPFALEKVERWQREAKGEDKHLSYRAMTFLSQIAPALTGQKGNKKLDVAYFRSYIYDRLSSFVPDEITEFLKILENETKVPLLKDDEIGGLYDDADISKLVIPRLANLITARLYKLSEGTVKQYLKKIVEVDIDDHTKGFAVEE